MKLLNVTIKRNAVTLFSFRGDVVSFRLSVTDKTENTVQVSIPMMSATVDILTNEPLGTYDVLQQGDYVEIYSDEQVVNGQPNKPIFLYLQTATHTPTKGNLQLVCVRKELTEKAPVRGAVRVSRTISAYYLENVSLEGDKEVDRLYDYQSVVEEASDYAISMAWLRPWDSTTQPFAPDALMLLPYLGQLTEDDTKVVELFYPGFVDKVPDDSPVYYLDASCILSQDIQSAQPPITYLRISSVTEGACIQDLVGEGTFTTIERTPEQGGTYRTPNYPAVALCTNTLSAVSGSTSSLRFLDGTETPMPKLSTSDPSLDLEPWGYTTAQVQALTSSWTSSAGTGQHYYSPVGVTDDYVVFVSSTLLLVCDKRTMDVVQQFSITATNFLTTTYTKTPVFLNVPRVPPYEAFLLPFDDGANYKALALVHNTDMNSWTFSEITLMAKTTGSSYANYTYAQMRASDPTPALVIGFNSNYPRTYLSLVIVRFSPAGNLAVSVRAVDFTSSSTAFVMDFQCLFAGVASLARVMYRYQSSDRQTVVVAGVSATGSYSNIFTDGYSFPAGAPIRGSFLGVYDSGADVPARIQGVNIPTSNKTIIGDSSKIYYREDLVEDATSFDVSTELGADVADWNVDKTFLVFKRSEAATTVVSSFYDYNPLRPFRGVEKDKLIPVAKGEENIVDVPGLVGTMRVNYKYILKDHGRVTLTIQKVGYSKGVYSGQPEPQQEVTIDTLPLLAIGAYVKVYPSGRYGDDNLFVMKITGYKISYDGVAVAVVTGVVVSEDISPETTVYEYRASNLPSRLWNDDCKVFVWVWGGIYGAGDWIQATKRTTTSFTWLVRAQQIDGFKVCRCHKDTTVPYWNAQGDVAGRIYNVSADITVTPSIYVYLISTLYDYYPQ